MGNLIKSNFEGIPIMETPSSFRVGFIEGRYEIDLFKAARDLARKKYNSAKPLMLGYGSFNHNDRALENANPFYVVLVNEVLRSDSTQRLHTATQADIERILRAGNPLGIGINFLVDTALVLRSAEDPYEPNDLIVKDLTEQIKKRFGNLIEFPIMIPLCYLELKLAPLKLESDDAKSDRNYGLSFNLTKDAEIVHSPGLNHSGRYNSVDLKTGLPLEVGSEGSRMITAPPIRKQKGIFSLFLYRTPSERTLDLNASWSNLTFIRNSRVVVCGEAAYEKDLESRAG